MTLRPNDLMELGRLRNGPSGPHGSQNGLFYKKKPEEKTYGYRVGTQTSVRPAVTGPKVDGPHGS